MSNKKYNFTKNKTKDSSYLVISDSSQMIEKQIYNPNQNQLSKQKIQERPIRHRQHQPVSSLEKSVFNNKTSKKIKLNEQSEQDAITIRFNSKPGVQQQQQNQIPYELMNKKKLKKAIPWMSKQTRQISDVCLRLHNEIVQFYQYLSPTKKQHETRLKIFRLVQRMILQKYPQAKVKIFGSFATKLYLPDGDIDITVLLDIQPYQQRKVYQTIYKIIRKCQGSIFYNIEYIKSSKVPLIKFVHVDSQIQFDISINKMDGLKQIQHVQRMKINYPEFEPLVFVLKTVLKIRNMHETYTGGVGSFLLFCMIFHFLRYVQSNKHYLTLGEFVLKFLEFYGINEKWDKCSVYVRHGEQVSRARQPGTLSFYSPQDESHDIGRSAFKVRDVLNVFKNRYRVITGKNFQQGQSILKQLVNPSLEEFKYYRYEKEQHKREKQ